MPGFKKGPRAVAPAEGTTPNGRTPMDAFPTITEPRRIDPPSRIPPEVLEEFGVSRVAQLTGIVEDGRRLFLEGMKIADTPECRDLHVQLGALVNAIDDLRIAMVEREQGEDR